VSKSAKVVLGWLAARGASLDDIRADRWIGGNRTPQAIHRAAVRWRVPLGEPMADVLAVHIPSRDREALEQAAANRGLSAAPFTATLIHTIAREQLFNAVLDDDQ
jgi:hypothetical protein